MFTNKVQIVPLYRRTALKPKKGMWRKRKRSINNYVFDLNLMVSLLHCQMCCCCFYACLILQKLRILGQPLKRKVFFLTETTYSVLVIINIHHCLQMHCLLNHSWRIYVGSASLKVRSSGLANDMGRKYKLITPYLDLGREDFGFV